MQVSVGGLLGPHTHSGGHQQQDSISTNSSRRNSSSSSSSSSIMKERRGGVSGVVGGGVSGESLFSFRRSNNRYSLHLDKPNKKESDVTLKRASWSSFPLLRFSSPEEKNNCKERLQNKSQSNEEIKNNLNGISRGIAPPVVSQKIGCNFLRGSTASIRSAFTSNSSSPPSTTSSCSSNNSSPATRSAASTGNNSSITSILEGSGCDSQYGSCSTLEDSLPYLPAAASLTGHTTTGSLTSRSTSDTFGVIHHNHNPLAYLTSSRGPSSVSSFLEEEEDREEEIKDKPTTAPKILYAHKKTPDLKRKTRKQLVKDIEFIKTHGVVPEHIEDLTINKPRTIKSEEEKENVIPLAINNKKAQQKPKSNFKFMQNYRFLSKMDTKKKNVSPSDSDNGTYDSGTHSPSRDMWLSANSDTTADLSDESRRSSRASSVSGDKNRLSPVSCDSQSLSDLEIHNDILTALRNDHNGALNGGQQADAHSRLGLSEPIIGDFSSLFDRQLHKFKVFGEIIEEEEGSECDLSEFMVHAEESNRFERSIEHSLEMLGERDSLERDSMERDSVERDFGVDLESNPSEHSESTEICKEERSSKTKSQDESKSTFVSKVQLKLDLSTINKASPPSQEFRRYLLRHISEEHINTIDEQVELRSSASSPSTPRSPAIDIDDVFKQKQREIVDGSKDDMLRVREVAQRLKLSTRRPSYVDWLGSIKTKKKLGKEELESKRPKSSEHDDVEEELTDEKRKENLNSAMCWLRKELNEMRVQDQQLARQLMQLRLELQRLRLVRSCSNHQALVEEVTNEAEEQKFFETSDVYDVYEELPDLRESFSPVLREIGVTRMNITSRRFSLR